MAAEITSAAKTRFTLAGSDPVAVVLELGPVYSTFASTSASQERAAALKKAFAAQADPVRSAIELLGGRVTGAAWINQTLRAEMTPSTAALIALRDDVIRIDVASPIYRQSLDLEG